MVALQSAGYSILEPFGENTRFDLVVDDGHRLLKLQCKSGRLRRGTVEFNACSHYGHHRNPTQVRRSYAGEIDAFGVYCHDTGGVYVVPVDVCGNVHVSLRVQPPANNQAIGIKWAADFELGVVDIRVPDRAGRPLLDGPGQLVAPV
jgi:hypothetical protein